MYFKTIIFEHVKKQVYGIITSRTLKIPSLKLVFPLIFEEYLPLVIFANKFQKY